MKKLFLLLALIPTVAFAQTPPYEAPDAELWGQMKIALGKLPMSIEAHQGIGQVLESVEKAAIAKAAEAKAKKPLPPK